MTNEGINNIENIENDTFNEPENEGNVKNDASTDTNAEVEVNQAQQRTMFGKKDRHYHCKLEINRLKTENAELQDKFLRLYSEFDNFRKRTQKERLDLIKNASQSLITGILPVLDDLERAISYNANSDVSIESMREGELLIYQKLLNLLKQRGLTAIETKEVPFNTDFHEAISIVPAQNPEDKGKILEEVEKGYLLNDKVIRFSKVIIYQ
ncbi:MAG: nucleotide exchange factor GrpE [Bacteroidales bacterium]|jgi:molecular chaperone GrpE|nr:nucleotide exchange factor GrpE [Bacteroidales bacterium]